MTSEDQIAELLKEIDRLKVVIQKRDETIAYMKREKIGNDWR